jgi:NAD+ synthase (glutamine-hydrolysing)
MEIYLHQTQNTLLDFKVINSNLLEDIKFAMNLSTSSIHIYPELYLTGYPLQDICWQHSFIKNFLKNFKEFESALSHQCSTFTSSNGNTIANPENKKRPLLSHLFLVGGPNYENVENHFKLKNCIYAIELTPVQNSAGNSIQGYQYLMKPIYEKKLLPSYDIFEESKYFVPGEKNHIYQWNNMGLGLLICEDMWPNKLSTINPLLDLFEESQHNTPLDLIINLSASPYHLEKKEARFHQARVISQFFKVPLIYVNQVSGEDEILFDGGSFVVENTEVKINLLSFQKDSAKFNFELKNSTKKENSPSSDLKKFKEASTLNFFYQPTFINQLPDPKILNPKLSHDQCQEILNALIFGLKEYLKKCGTKNVLIALSGGLDSALCLAIAHLAKIETEVIFMPSKFTSTLSFQLATQIAKNCQTTLISFPIKFLHSTLNQQLQDTFKGIENFSLVNENLQSRLRGLILMARSNQTQGMVINTSNKSELSVGYSTLYGDSIGGLSLLGDLFKSEVFDLAHFINKNFSQLIPEEIIKRPPSAELKDNQTDEDSLLPYDRLDSILKGYLEMNLTFEDFRKLNFTEQELKKVFQLHVQSEYKRVQMCPIIKVKKKSFGFGHRVSITKHNQYLFN